MEKVNVEVTADNNEVVVRQGDALKLREPERVNIAGTISSVSRFLENRYGNEGVEGPKSYIEVDREVGKILLNCDENNFYGAVVIGSLEVSPEFKNWNINTGKEYDAKELAEFIKMNRSAFESKQEAMKLASELSNLKVKTDKELEKADNNRGEMRFAISQKVIEMNIPNEITLCLPLFKGEQKETFKVEIYVNPSTFDVQLVSPDAKERIDDSINQIIDAEIDKIKEITNNEIVIIEK
jgi:hypothetical protein